ncbi:MAG TPA: hypothetical protein VF487_10405 [Chitinophagaceae bacterium]
MSTHLLIQLKQQKNAISLDAARKYTHNWHRFINTLYKGQDKHMPHGIFIPMTDLRELRKLQKKITHIKKHGEEERIYIVGIRAYYCLKTKVMVPHPVSSADYPVEAVLVAVYQTNKRVTGSKHEYDYDKGYPTYDLVAPVPSVKDENEPGDGGDYSIYDITQPCPNLCDTESPLY